MNIQIGNIHQKAHPLLSWFVISCMVVTVGLLYVMQKTEAAAQVLASTSETTDQSYLNGGIH